MGWAWKEAEQRCIVSKGLLGLGKEERLGWLKRKRSAGM